MVQTLGGPWFIDKVIDVCCAGRASSTGAVVEETAEFGLSTVSCGMKLALVAGRALRTGTGAGLTPATRAGKERARRESDSQVTCHPNSLQAAVWHGQTRHTRTTSVPPPPPPLFPPPPPPPLSLPRGLDFFHFFDPFYD